MNFKHTLSLILRSLHLNYKIYFKTIFICNIQGFITIIN